MKLNHRKIGVIMLGVMLMAAVTACGGSSSEETKAEKTAQQEEQKEAAAGVSKSGYDVAGLLEDFGAGEDYHFELNEAQKSFINGHLQLFPAAHDDLEELSKYVDNTLDYAHMIKNPSSYTGKFAVIDGLSVIQIFERQLEGGGEYGYRTRINAQDGDGNLYQIFYIGKSTPLVEDNVARVVAMPIANSSYTNLSGTTKLTMVMLASLAEDSERAEITYGYFGSNAAPQYEAEDSSVNTNVPVQYEVQEPSTVTDVLEDDIDWTYIIPDSDSRYLDRAIDLSGMSTYELRLARNEIYARHGRKFSDPALQSYFNSKGWYAPTVEADQFDESCLNAYEKENLWVIKDVEEHGV